MALSGVTTFDPTFDDILTDAAGMVGGGPILAEELLSAQRGMDYLLISMQNRGPLLHKIETTAVTCSSSLDQYTLDHTVIDVATIAMRTSLSTSDSITLFRHGYERWADLPEHTNTGRPVAYWFDRRRDSGIINLWPVPNQAYVMDITFHKVAESTFRAFNNIDVPRRFIPAVIYGIAYYVGLRRGSRVPTERLALIKAEYDNHLRDAMREDRERGSVFVKVGRR